MSNTHVSICNSSFQCISACLDLHSLHTQTVDRLAEPTGELHEPNSEMFGWKFKNKLTCRTIAQFTANRNAALVSSAPVVVHWYSSKRSKIAMNITVESVSAKLPSSDWQAQPPCWNASLLLTCWHYRMLPDSQEKKHRMQAYSENIEGNACWNDC